MSNDTVVSLAAPARVSDPLTELLRTGARRLVSDAGRSRRLTPRNLVLPLSPVALVSSLVARIEDIGPNVNAFTHTFFDRARDEARAAEKRYAGPWSPPEAPRRPPGRHQGLARLEGRSHDLRLAALRASPHMAFSVPGCSTE